MTSLTLSYFGEPCTTRPHAVLRRIVAIIFDMQEKPSDCRLVTAAVFKRHATRHGQHGAAIMAEDNLEMSMLLQNDK